MVSLSRFLLALGLLITGNAYAESDLSRQTITHDGAERGYYLYVPQQVARATTKVPLVIDMHGGGGNGRIAAKMTGFSAIARREGFIVVYPDGSGRLGNKLLTWNAGHCCGHALREKTDDIGFISTLIDHLAAQYPIDTRRVYATGMSNGGMMAHRLGYALPNKIAAIAPVVGGLFGDERTPTLPVAALIINGALDEAVPAAGGKTGGRFSEAWDGTPLQPAAYQGQFWAKANGCDTTPQYSAASSSFPAERWVYNCPHGFAVERLMVADSGHAWPGGRAGSRRADTPSQSINASAMIWDFFKSKSRL